MKVLTVKHPWAWAIAEGHKLIENRLRLTNHTGPLAIHAARSWSKDGAVDQRVLTAFEPFLTAHQLARAPDLRLDPAEQGDRFAFGAVIAVVNLVDCHPAWQKETCCQPWGDPQAYHWVLSDVRKLDESIPARGQLGLWEFDLGEVAT